jgi:outer membrane assembly lipoprotein YfiO
MGKHSIGIALAAVLLLSIPVTASAQWVWTPQTGRFIDMDRLPKETPELQVAFARQLMTEGRYRQAIRETEKFDTFYRGTEFSDDNQFLRGEIRMAQGSHLRAAQEFQLVALNYRDTDLYDRAIAKQYEIGDYFYDEGVNNQDRRWRPFKKRPFRRAIEVYTMVIENEPVRDQAAQAQYKIGLCHFTREEYLAAGQKYRTVIEQYPLSDWVDEASYGLAETYHMASLPPAYDQVPSQLTINAIDEFKARFPADARNDELVPVRKNMFENIASQRLETARFYVKRRKFQAALITHEVVVKQFPGTTAAGEAQSWLDENAEGIRGQSWLMGPAGNRSRS